MNLATKFKLSSRCNCSDMVLNVEADLAAVIYELWSLLDTGTYQSSLSCTIHTHLPTSFWSL
jgi:hypothetical protein